MSKSDIFDHFLAIIDSFEFMEAKADLQRHLRVQGIMEYEVRVVPIGFPNRVNGRPLNMSIPWRMVNLKKHDICAGQMLRFVRV